MHRHVGVVLSAAVAVVGLGHPSTAAARPSAAFGEEAVHTRAAVATSVQSARIGLRLGVGVVARPPTLRTGAASPRRFWVHDTSRYTSPWYAGARRTMVAFGCTRAPYYDADPRCSKRHGFHHGLDLAMPCGTPLYAAYRTRVVDPTSSGSLGSAYGAWAFRLRSPRLHKDFVIGHVRHVYVSAGDLVSRGQLIARASNAGAPDGCHLHIEVRPHGGGYQSAVRPYPYLRLTRAD